MTSRSVRTGPQHAVIAVPAVRSPATRAPERSETLDHAFQALRRTLGQFHGMQRRVLRDRITPVHAMVLRFISTQRRTTPKEIAAFAGLTQGTITALLDRLEGDRYVRRTRSREDRRVVHVTLTDRASTVVAALMMDARQEVQRLFEGWTREEIDALSRLLNKLADGAQPEAD